MQDAVQQPSQQISPNHYARQDDVNSNHLNHIGIEKRAHCGTPHSNDEQGIFTTAHDVKQIVSSRESHSVLLSDCACQRQQHDSPSGLAARLRGAMVKTYTGAEFLPHHALEEILTEHNVREGFVANDFEDSKELALYIHTHAKKAFAILILIGLEAFMPLLAYHKFKDEYLPLVSTDGCTISISGIPRDHPALRPFGEWQASDIERFCTKQWLALAPTFHTQRDQEFESSIVLPFVAARHVKPSIGGFGRISQVEVHRGHLPPTTKVSTPIFFPR